MLDDYGPKWFQFKKNGKDSVESRGVTILTKSWGGLDGFFQEQTKLQGMEEESKKREEQIISDLEVQLEWDQKQHASSVALRTAVQAKVKRTLQAKDTRVCVVVDVVVFHAAR